jgi:hypothetical protein
MIQKIQVCTVAALAATCLVACESTAVDPNPITGNYGHAGTSALPTAQDVAKCELITKQIISNNDRDETILSNFYTQRFAGLIREGCTAPPGMGIVLNYDFIHETQDDLPKPVALGPGKIVRDKIHVPFVQAHLNSPPFTKTWIFVKENGTWRAEDIVTAMPGEGDDSMFEGLSEM